MSKSFRNLLICALLLSAVFVAYWRSLDNGFIVYYDDGEYVTRNPQVQAGITARSIAWAFTTMHSANWHPLTWISHMLDFQIYRLAPSGHHLTSLLLHAASMILLFLLLTRLTGSVWRSAFVAALFGVHPLHVESVAWVAERKDVLSTFFWMLTMLAYVRYTDRPGIGRYSLVVAAFALGLMSKPMLVTLPFTLLLLDYWPLRRSDQSSVTSDQSRSHGPSTKHQAPWNLLLEKAPLFAMSAASSVITYVAQRHMGAVSRLDSLSLAERVSNALVAYVSYIGKMFWPVRLPVICPMPLEPRPMWHVAGAALVMVGVTLLTLRARRNRPYLLVGWLWYVITLIPVIGLVQVGSQAMADRYTYVPLIGLFVMIAWGIGDANVQRPTSNAQRSTQNAAGRPLAWGLTIVAVVVLGALVVRTRDQVGYWRDSITLMEHTIAVTKDNYDAYDNLGLTLTDLGRYEEAIERYETAIRISPDNPRAHNDMGTTLVRMNRQEEALREFREAARLDPTLPDPHYNIGKLMSMQGKLDQAGREYALTLQLDPNNAEAHNNLGNIYLRQGKLDKAVEEYREALRIKPGLAQAQASLDAIGQARGHDEASVVKSNEHYNQGVAFQNQGRTDEAIREYRQAIHFRPDFAQAHNNLALAYFEREMFADAWKEVYLCRKHGYEPHPEFVKALADKMPEPSP